MKYIFVTRLYFRIMGYITCTQLMEKSGVYISSDLENWSDVKPVFEAYDGFWGTKAFWAPEVHIYNGKFYMFATFYSDDRCRGTQILVSDTPDGEFSVWSEVITPEDWMCLDGTLYVEDEVPYMVFCHEWLQVKDGEVCAVKLTKDLKSADGEPIILWRASEAAWVAAFDKPNSGDYITDGPFLYRDSSNRLCSLWSSFSMNGYALGRAYSDNGRIDGKWMHDDTPIFDKDGGHGMLFETFEGKKLLTLHVGNSEGNIKHAVFIEFEI